VDQISTIGLNLAEQVFQVHGLTRAGLAVARRKLRRGQVLCRNFGCTRFVGVGVVLEDLPWHSAGE
jgi:hypothetical protein